MRDFFVFAGKSSADFHVYVANSNKFGAPEKNVESIQIPGRNGALIVEDGSFSNVSVQYEVYVDWRLKDTLNSLRNFLNLQSGYQRLEDSFHPDEYRMARFEGAFDVSSSDRKNAGLSLSFDCKPQRFLKSGEERISLTTSSAVRNPTQCPARPVYRVYGNGSFAVGEVAITVTGNNSFIDIDSETMDASREGVNMNSSVTMRRRPELAAGVNRIALSGISRLVVTPRWWTL